MPTLQFKGKTIIWNHHLSIPYHTLDEVAELSFQPDKSGGNLIVEGDNLLALKALLPQYAGKVKCIYIDPPYNTGNEHWVYNDNVNSPLIREWLGKEVAKDDLTRHDKWLCMMVPRIRLIRELLADDGLVLMSVDDHEYHRARQIVEEIFGLENLMESIVWKKSYGGGSKTKHAVNLHEYILVAAKDITAIEAFELPPNPEALRYYKLEDEKLATRGPYRLQPLATNSMDERPNLRYPIQYEGENILPEKQWQWSRERTLEAQQNNELVFKKNKQGQWSVSYKQYLRDENGQTRGTKPYSIIDSIFTQQGTSTIESLFGDGKVFAFPKPVELIKHLVAFCSRKDSIILDSFAGSGTTMHAVAELNKEDGGSRTCILVQMTEADLTAPKKNVCKDITRERVKRAIEANKYDSGFRYVRVGRAIDAESLLSGDLPTYEQFAKYVFYLCTGEHLAGSSIREKDYFVADHARSVIYLIYRQDIEELTRLALNLSVAEKISAEHPGKNLIVYAPACFLDEDFLDAKGIQFVNIPYGLFQKNGRR